MIDILLATYNGAKYLDVQIASIVTQTYQNWNLYIHDDGSSDNTVAIIKKWEKLDSRIHFIDDEAKHLGPGNNFFHLLQFCKSEYICFCDQDDFWFENKLSEYIDFISNRDKNIPFCCIFSCYLWNKEYIKPFLHDKAITLSRILFTGGTQGCSIVFNHALLEKAKCLIKNNIYLHDYVIVLLGVLFGGVEYVPMKLMLYRQHDANVTGNMPKSRMEKFLRAIHNSDKTFIYPKMYDDIKIVYASLKNEISIKNLQLIEKYFDIANSPRYIQFWKLLFSNFSIGQHSRLYFMTKFLLRKEYK